MRRDDLDLDAAESSGNSSSPSRKGGTGAGSQGETLTSGHQFVRGHCGGSQIHQRDHLLAAGCKKERRPAEVDASLVAFFNLRYLQPTIGEQLLAGLVQVCPELGCVGSLCPQRRHRALRGWRRWCPARSRLVWDHLGDLSCRPVDHGGLRPVPPGHVEAFGASSPSSVRPPGAPTSDLCLMALIGFAAGAAGTIQNLRHRQEYRPFSILGAFPAKSMTDPEDGRSSGEDFQLTSTEIHGGHSEKLQRHCD